MAEGLPCFGAGLAAYTLRRVLPLPVSLALWHAAGAGVVVAAAATEALAGHTTGLLGKVRAGMGHGQAAGGGDSPSSRWQIPLDGTACLFVLLGLLCGPEFSKVGIVRRAAGFLPQNAQKHIQTRCIPLFCTRANPHLTRLLPAAARRRYHQPAALHAALALPPGPARQAGAAAALLLRARL